MQRLDFVDFFKLSEKLEGNFILFLVKVKKGREGKGWGFLTHTAKVYHEDSNRDH